jgi:hypothetical protein
MTAMAFFENLFEELAARRRRLREAVGRRADLVEFAVIGGLALAAFTPIFNEHAPSAARWALAIPVAFALGYVLLDWRRQAALKAGRAGPAHDRLALYWMIAVPALGAAAFVAAALAPPPPADRFAVPSGGRALAVDIAD